VWWGWPGEYSLFWGPESWVLLFLIPRSRFCLSGWGCGGGWVEHNDRFMVVGDFGSWGSARCWVLRRHLGGVFSGAPGLDRLTPCVVGVVVVVVGWGVVVC
jgi:hypothetical protein